ncbi:hypothetical protein A1C_03320 [Rickettsia akari str. Hartford]|uniref:Uncharacterized protein n=1 Tax=Rickettsia akari (strain Hartford) TaxID=293614 RepID=A8GNH5_RICAH|nr:hypothetical protein [Rickettsia akari]ABV74950.1 hypothetical protein A1C_03320 [Rickettsia akari str. Hartford]
MQNLLPLLIIFFGLNTYSNPMPLGLELNKTTNIDLTKKNTKSSIKHLIISKDIIII